MYIILICAGIVLALPAVIPLLFDSGQQETNMSADTSCDEYPQSVNDDAEPLVYSIKKKDTHEMV